MVNTRVRRQLAVVENVARILIYFAAPVRRKKSARRMRHTANLAALKHRLRIAEDEVHLTLDIAVVVKLPRNLARLNRA